eukprot:g13266.t2
MADTSRAAAGGGGTPEILRRRRDNIQRNAVRWNALGLPAAGGGGGGSLLSVAIAGNEPASVREEGGGGRGGSSERDGGGSGGGGGGGGSVLAPLEELVKRWPGRGEQITEIAGHIGESTDGVPVPPLLVTGPPCSGKTSVVRAVLEHRGCSYAYVNCAEVVQRRDLLEAVVEQVAGGSREGILVANRVDRKFGSEAAARNSERSSSGPASEEPAGLAPGSDGPNGEDELPQVGGENDDEDDGADERQHKRGKRARQPQRAKCSSWNVFFRQLAALLARRSSALVGKTAAGATAGAGSSSGNGGRVNTGSGSGGGGVGGGARPNFAPKLFVVLDRAEALLSENVAGIGVGSGGLGATGNGWRGQDMLANLAGLQGMVDSFAGFAGETRSAGGSYPASAAAKAHLPPRPSTLTSTAGTPPLPASGRHGTPPRSPPVCPILISQNLMFASEVMGGSGAGGGDWGGAGGSNRSLVARASLVQLRFPPYGKEHLPDVLTSIAPKFGLDLSVDLSAVGGKGAGGTAEERSTLGTEEGRSLFRKMAVALVSSLKNETRNPWHLGVQAARIWPDYKQFAEDGCFDAQLTAALKPLLVETTKRLHGFGGAEGQQARRNSSLAHGNGGVTSRLGGSSIKNRSPIGSKSKPVSLGLSRSAKHLLVCAYLASHNSRDTDRDMFTAKGTRRSSKRQRNARSGGAAGNAENLVEAGVRDLPEAREFQLERLLSIMASIVAVTEAGTKAANSMGSTELFAQIRSLTKLNLVRTCGQRRNFDLDAPSYRCNISKQLAEEVANEIGIELSQYLVTA